MPTRLADLDRRFLAIVDAAFADGFVGRRIQPFWI